MKRYLGLHFTKRFAEAFFGTSSSPASVITAGWQEGCDIRLNALCCTMAELRQAWPEGWEPDEIWVWSPELFASPVGLPDEAAPIIALVSDWPLGFTALLQTLPGYDYIFADREGTALLRAHGIRHAAPASLYSFDPRLHRPLAGLEEDIDVLAIVHWNHELHPERAQWLMRLCRLRSEGMRVQLLPLPDGEAYNELLNRSKAVFVHSSRGEMNIRAYEAAAAGRLIFYEDRHGEAEAHLTPFADYVPYRDDNLAELLRAYLAAPQVRAEVAASGRRKIVEADGYDAHFAAMRQRLDALALERRTPERSAAARLRQLRGELEQLYAASAGRSPRALALVLAEAARLTPPERDAWWLNARACVRMAEALAEQAPLERQIARLELAVADWRRAAELEPALVVPLFNALSALALTGNHKAVLRHFDAFEARALAASPASFEGLFFPTAFDDFRVARESARFRAGSAHAAGALLTALVCSEAYAYKGAAHLALGQVEPAQEALRRSVVCRADNVSARYDLARCALALGRAEEAERQLRAALDYAPLYWPAVIALCETLARSGRADEAAALALDYRFVAEAMPMYAPWLAGLQPFLPPQSG